jgi:acetoin utilization protein AcuB
MASIPTIGSVMTPHAIEVDVDASAGVAEDLMIDNEVRHLVVMDSGELVGAISDRDLAFASSSPDAGLRDRVHVRDVCSFDVFVVEPGEPLDRIVSVMAERHVGSAIVSEGGKVLGVFTATDACRCLGEVLRGA